MTRAISPRDMVLTPRGLRYLGRLWPCTIGRGGLTPDKREGDNATPRAVMRLTGTLYRADRLPRPAPWARPIGPRDLWCDDPAHPAYNQMVRAPFPASHEALRRADPLYDLVLLSDWNRPGATPGRGSAIFLHRWRARGYPTAGCIAFAPADLRLIARHAAPGTRVITL